MQVQVLGSGDAFGSGGRFQSAYLYTHRKHKILVDCGSTVMPALHKLNEDPAAISAIVLSHLHGDHMGGIPYFLLDAQWNSKRTTPLTIIGPDGTKQKVITMMDCLYEGVSISDFSFKITFEEYTKHVPFTIDGFEITPFAVTHSALSKPHGLRIESDNKIVAYSGDTSWNSNLIPLSRNADVFICECCTKNTPLPNHLNFQELSEHVKELSAKKIILTHLTETDYSVPPPFELAKDLSTIVA